MFFAGRMFVPAQAAVKQCDYFAGRMSLPEDMDTER